MTDCILIADDEEDFCAILSRLLSSLGYQTYWTTSPSDVLPLMDKVHPSCVLLDLHFPNVNGMTVLSRIKKHDKHVPVVILTGEDSVRTAVEAIQQGAFHYLIKPLDKDKKELKNVLAKAVSQGKITISVSRTASFSEASRQAVWQIEKQWILDALEKSHWRRGQAARILGIDAKTLYSKMKSYGIHQSP